MPSATLWGFPNASMPQPNPIQPPLPHAAVRRVHQGAFLKPGHVFCCRHESAQTGAIPTPNLIVTLDRCYICRRMKPSCWCTSPRGTRPRAWWSCSTRACRPRCAPSARRCSPGSQIEGRARGLLGDARAVSPQLVSVERLMAKRLMTLCGRASGSCWTREYRAQCALGAGRVGWGRVRWGRVIARAC